METKKLLLNIVSNVVSFLVSMGISFFLTPYIISTVGKEAYGFVGLANNFVSYAQLFTLAINSLALRFITIKLHEGNATDANKYFTSIIFANIASAIILLIPASLIVLFMSNIVNVPTEIIVDVQILWGFIFMNFLINLITSTYNVATFATNRLELSAIRLIQSNLIRVFLLIVLFSFFEPKIWFLGIVAIICTLFIFATDAYYKKKLLPDLKVSKKYFDFEIICTIVKSGVWSVVTKLGQILSDGLDLLISNLFIDASAMGVLAIAKTIPTAITSLLITVSSVFSPQLTIFYAKSDTDGLKNEIIKSMKFSGLFTNIPLGFLLIYGDIFYNLWVPNENVSLIYLLSVLTVSANFVGGAVNTLFGVFTVTNKLKINSYMILITGVLNTVLVFVLLKYTDMGILAIAGVSSFTAITKNLTFTPIYAAMCLNLPKHTFFPPIIRYILVSFVVLCSFIGVRLYLNQTSWMLLIVAAIICGIIGLLINLCFLFTKKERNALFENLFKKI